SMQTEPSVAVAADGSFVVVWQSLAGAASSEIVAQRFDTAGAPAGGEIPVNQTTAGAQTAPAVAVAPGGSFVVVWESSDGSGTGVCARRFDATGAAQGDEFQVNQFTSQNQGLPRVAVDP